MGLFLVSAGLGPGLKHSYWSADPRYVRVIQTQRQLGIMKLEKEDKKESNQVTKLGSETPESRIWNEENAAE